MSTKTADKMPNDENHLEPGEQKVQKDPPRFPGTLAAKWGDNPPPDRDGYPDHYGTGALSEGKKDRAEMLEEMFDEFGNASTADKALIAQNFSSTDRRPPHSPLLQKGAEAELRTTPSLREQVHGILGK
jgi:hypothetical protein